MSTDFWCRSCKGARLSKISSPTATYAIFLLVSQSLHPVSEMVHLPTYQSASGAKVRHVIIIRRVQEAGSPKSC